MEMLRDIMGDFVNPVKCRDAIKFMAAKGVKCVFLQQDDNSGIFEANAQGIYAVGDYRDLYPVAPDTILTSTVWNWEPGLTAILNAIAEDRWDEIRDKEWYWEMTVANGGLALGHFGHMVTEEQKAFAKDLTNKAATGELDLPYLDTW
jgi:basic membrane lipoprotein Med (substrate-binding protein (PBP1-ABC) superfamily)